jgi:hypothetical protein
MNTGYISGKINITRTLFKNTLKKIGVNLINFQSHHSLLRTGFPATRVHLTMLSKH